MWATLGIHWSQVVILVQWHLWCTWGDELSLAGCRHTPDVSRCSCRPFRSSRCPWWQPGSPLNLLRAAHCCRAGSCSWGQRWKVSTPAVRSWLNGAFISLSDPDLSAGHQEMKSERWDGSWSLVYAQWLSHQGHEHCYLLQHCTRQTFNTKRTPFILYKTLHSHRSSQ